MYNILLRISYNFIRLQKDFPHFCKLFLKLLFTNLIPLQIMIFIFIHIIFLQLDAPLFITWFQCCLSAILCLFFSKLSKFFLWINFPTITFEFYKAMQVSIISVSCNINNTTLIILKV